MRARRRFRRQRRGLAPGHRLVGELDVVGHPLLEQARERAIAGDPPAVKKLLLDKVAAGRGTKEEVNLLKEACKAIRDTPCVEMCKKQGG